MYIAFRFEWTYGAAAVIAVFTTCWLRSASFDFSMGSESDGHSGTADPGWIFGQRYNRSVLIGLGKTAVCIDVNRYTKSRTIRSTKRSLAPLLLRSGFSFCSVNGALWRGSAAGIFTGTADRHHVRNVFIDCYREPDHVWFGPIRHRREAYREIQARSHQTMIGLAIAIDEYVRT